MQPIQYRIGNYVHCLGKTRNIIGISIRLRPDVGYFEFEEIKNPLKGIHVNSVDLTEEWLIKLGFMPHPVMLNHWTLYKLGGNLSGEQEQILIYKTKDGFEWNRFRAVIKYVHQLQNLHYALTGDELCVK